MAMNIFRMSADLSHLISIFILLHSIETNKSIVGLSMKTQILYVIVFITRYLDIFTQYLSLYNTLMKIFFVASSIYTVYIMKYKYERSIKEHLDTFPVKYLLGGSFVLGVVTAPKYDVINLLWSFSLWLETVAILPQLFMLQRTGKAENLTTHYIFALGIYRALYIPNWFYRWFFEQKFVFLPVLTGVVQTLIYSDFFYIYYTK